MKVKSTELQIANLNITKESFEKAYKVQSVGHSKKLKKLKEIHEVACYKLNGSFDKQAR